MARRQHLARHGPRRGLQGAAFLALASVPFVMVLSNSLLIPVLPSIREALDTSYFRAGLLVTAFSVPAGLAIPLAGIVSDRLGRKAVMVPALLLFGLGGLLAGLAGWLSPQPYGWLLVGRILQGIGGGGTYQIALALAGDALRPGSRASAMGALEAANALGKVVSPILGGAAALLSWFAPFFVYPALAWTSAAAVAWLVPEPAAERERARPWRAYLADLERVWADRGAALAAAFAVGGTMLFMLFGVLSWFSDVLEQRFGLRQLGRGLVIAVPLLVAASTSWASGAWWLRRRAQAARPAVLTGAGLVAAALAVLAARPDWGLWALVAVLAILGLGYGLTLPAVNALATGAAGRAQRGLVTAVYGTVRFLGAALGPPAFDLALRLGPALPFLLMAGWTGAAWILAFRFLRGEPAAASGPGARQDGDPVFTWE